MYFLGSSHSAMIHPLSIWKETAKNVFSNIKEDQRRGVYDKVVIDCAFKEDLRLRKKYPDGNGGCEGFYPSLTTNGMCYTFNGKATSELWQSSEISTTFANLFSSQSQSNRTFGGQRSVQGNSHLIQALLFYLPDCILLNQQNQIRKDFFARFPLSKLLDSKMQKLTKNENIFFCLFQIYAFVYNSKLSDVIKKLSI